MKTDLKAGLRRGYFRLWDGREMRLCYSCLVWEIRREGTELGTAADGSAGRDELSRKKEIRM